MNATAQSIALDDAKADVITEGRSSDAGRAIGEANLATLQAAAQRCKEAAKYAQGRGLTYKQYQTRAVLCRRRIELIAKQQKATV